MGDEQVTLIISDLHVGGGKTDKGDDHIYQNDQLVRFLGTQSTSPEGKSGNIELIFNGDFLEFAQTNPKAFSHPSDDFWCSETESLNKLESIIAGHPGIFTELGKFQENGNVVTIVPGNHDVDFYWPKVQNRLRQVAGNGIRFELGKEWIDRYSGRLQIGHGHMNDPANKFKHWDNPILGSTWGNERLEMCPGTLFMVKFVNKLEDAYPFADNLLPVTKLATVLLRDDKAGLASVGWMFSVFSMTSPISTLGTSPLDQYGTQLLARFQTDNVYFRRLDATLKTEGLEAPRADLNSGNLNQIKLAELMFQLLDRVSDDDWHALFDAPQPSTLGSDDVTLSALIKAGFDDCKEKLRSVAQYRIDSAGASVIVMGHTHQPDKKRLVGGVYYNPGCWTRYLELNPGQQVTLADLKDESRYPYQLNFVRVSEPSGGALKSEMECFERG